MDYPMWYYFKEPIVEIFNIPREALHIHFGLTLFLLVVLLFRSCRRRFLYAWIVVLAAQSINELLDFHDWYRWTQSWNWSKSLGDYFHTMIWPSVLLALSTCWVQLQPNNNNNNNNNKN